MPVISKPSIGGGLRRKKDALNVARDLQVVIEPFLFVRLRIDDRVVKRESRLLGDRFEDDKIARGKWRAHRAVGHREHAHVLSAVKQRRYHDGGGAEGGLAQFRQLRRVVRDRRGEEPRRFSRHGREAFAGIDRGASGDNSRARRAWSAACCKMRSGTSTSGGQPLERNAGVKRVPVRSAM